MRQAPFHATPRHMSPHHRPLISVLSHPCPPLGFALSLHPARASLYQLIALLDSSVCEVLLGDSARQGSLAWSVPCCVLGFLLPLLRPPHPKRVHAHQEQPRAFQLACSLSQAPLKQPLLHLLITSIRQPHSVGRYRRSMVDHLIPTAMSKQLPGVNPR